MSPGCPDPRHRGHASLGRDLRALAAGRVQRTGAAPAGHAQRQRPRLSGRLDHRDAHAAVPGIAGLHRETRRAVGDGDVELGRRELVELDPVRVGSREVLRPRAQRAHDVGRATGAGVPRLAFAAPRSVRRSLGPPLQRVDVEETRPVERDARQDAVVDRPLDRRRRTPGRPSPGGAARRASRWRSRRTSRRRRRRAAARTGLRTTRRRGDCRGRRSGTSASRPCLASDARLPRAAACHPARWRHPRRHSRGTAGEPRDRPPSSHRAPGRGPASRPGRSVRSRAARRRALR